MLPCVTLLASLLLVQGARPDPAGGRSAPGVVQDSREARLALEFLRTGRDDLVAEMGRTPAAAHLVRHARAFEYDVPRDSAAALVRSLVAAPGARRRAASAARAVAFFDGPLGRDASWAAEVARALPAGAPLGCELFLTFGYDIGVALPGTASLNAAHPHFARPGELRYYAIHECHHATFMRYQPPRPVAEWRSAADLLAQAEYALQLEGTAVWAAWRLREREGALAGDADYVALGDAGLLRRLEARYLAVHRALEARAGEPGPADAATRELLLSLYGPDRIFYRLGAHAARAIERRRGRAAVAALVEAGPAAFLRAYLDVRDGRPPGEGGAASAGP